MVGVALAAVFVIFRGARLLLSFIRAGGDSSHSLREEFFVDGDDIRTSHGGKVGSDGEVHYGSDE